MRADGPLLLVEDNPDDQLLLRRALERARVQRSLVVANDGLEAAELLFGGGTSSSLDALPSLILLDVNIPKLDGHELLSRIRADARTRRIPVVMLTSSCEEPDVHRAYGLGVNSYVRKPLDFGRFVEVTRVICQYWLDVNYVPPLDDTGTAQREARAARAAGSPADGDEAGE